MQTLGVQERRTYSLRKSRFCKNGCSAAIGPLVVHFRSPSGLSAKHYLFLVTC